MCPALRAFYESHHGPSPSRGIQIATALPHWPGCSGGTVLLKFAEIRLERQVASDHSYAMLTACLSCGIHALSPELGQQASEYAEYPVAIAERLYDFRVNQASTTLPPEAAATSRGCSPGSSSHPARSSLIGCRSLPRQPRAAARTERQTFELRGPDQARGFGLPRVRDVAWPNTIALVTLVHLSLGALRRPRNVRGVGSESYLSQAAFVITQQRFGALEPC